jgi:monoamine oxidase
MPTVLYPILLIMLSCCLFPSSINGETITYTSDVIVIGAGVSGLAAAKRLQSKGVSVTVVEGRARVGGRCWTQSITGTKNQQIPVDLGASFVHGDKGNVVLPLLAEAKIALAPKFTNFDSGEEYYSDGRPVPEKVSQKWIEVFEAFEGFLVNQQDRYDDKPDPGLQAIVNMYIKRRGLKGNMLTGFRYLLSVYYEHEYSGPLDKLSLWFDWGKEDFKGEDRLVTSGWQQFPVWLASSLKSSQLRLNTVVTEINSSARSYVMVKTNKGTLYAKKAIVTLPLGVLKKKTVKFVPPMPKTHLTALNRLDAGYLDKVILSFPSCFWDCNGDILNVVDLKDQIAWQEWMSLQRTLGKPVLVAFNAGGTAAEQENKSDDALVAEAMGVLKNVYGNDIPNPIDFIITRWGKDPMSYGAYSYLRLVPGAVLPNVDDPVAKLRTPFAAKRLWLAGEHTSDGYQSTVHGAYLSGMSQACALLQSIGKSC